MPPEAAAELRCLPTASRGSPSASYAKRDHTTPNRGALTTYPPVFGGCQASSDDFHGLLIGVLLHAVTNLTSIVTASILQQTDLLAMLYHMKRKTCSPPQPDRQPADTARHKRFTPNEPGNATARSLASVNQRQAAHVGPPVVRWRHDPGTGPGQAGGPIVCGAPPPSPSSTMSEEIRAENEDDAETTLDGLSQLETNGESPHVCSPGRQHDSLVLNMGRGATLPVTPISASGEHVRSLLTPPAEKSPQDQMRQHFVAVLQKKLAVRNDPGQQTATLVHPETMSRQAADAASTRGTGRWRASPAWGAKIRSM
ncbi:hypothetical protein LTR70_010741 [Exophiala xenobiotica]|uniref:Uncharacterized protein n=1 Tax=Lithohypha guttulata TaxID=1690604 RepID=A0ABR0JT06_9EURO|nr:hypothetical protein LTR24_010718 [Lithohypha guttulata]KAK5308913.1 hypothetical protein LTR70_010741 [Exophiala xenobiotica]